MIAPKLRGKVCVIGTGYVGVASAIGLAELGWNVVGYDLIVERVRSLQQGEPPYNERGLAAALRRHLASGRLCFVDELSQALAGAGIVLVAVGTPANEDGSADLSALRQVFDQLEMLESDDAIVVVRSTVPPGTTDQLAQRMGGRRSVIYAPEFLREGSALSDFLNPSRIVIGGEDDRAIETYASLFVDVDAPLVRTSTVEAELIKGFSNAFLAARISLANEAANLCEAYDADALAVLAGVGADPRIGSSFLSPGLGFGGPCLDKDTRSLCHVASIAGVEATMLSAVLAVNDAQPRRIIQLLEEELGSVAGSTIGVWGLTYKAGTDDVRHSLAISIINDLTSRGARVRAFDPALPDVPRLVKCEVTRDPLSAAKADALIVLTDWPEFREVAPDAIRAALRRPIVVDGRSALDGAKLTAVGIRYRAIGRRRIKRPIASATRVIDAASG